MCVLGPRKTQYMTHRLPWRFVAALLALCVTGLAFGRNDAADLVVLEATAYTADAGHSMLDQDILALAESGRGDDVGRTHVLGTWFKGTKVYGRPAP